MPRPVRARPTSAIAVAGAVLLLAACAGTPAPEGSTSAGPAPSASARPTPSASVTPFPMGSSVSTTPLPDDLPQGCRDILNDAVLAQLEDVPLNAEGMGGGIRPDSSRVCVWGEPGAAATRLTTVIGYSPEREARDALYGLSSDGFTCYELRGGIRCEKTWDNPDLPVENGRTLFYRDGVIIDTQYSNLAPRGYTDAIIDALWPVALPGAATPAPTP